MKNTLYSDDPSQERTVDKEFTQSTPVTYLRGQETTNNNINISLKVSVQQKKKESIEF